MKYLIYMCLALCSVGMLYAQVKLPMPIFGGIQSPDKGLQEEINHLEEQQRKDPSYNNTLRIIQEYLSKNNVSKQSKPDTSCVKIIPIVFHVFHPAGKSGVPISQLDFAIDDLNKTFAGTNEDFETVNKAFDSIKSYTSIRFARALIDPEGNPTEGIVYYQDKQPGFGNSGPSWDKQIQSCAWDNYKYFNVYVQNDLFANNALNNSGYCFYPSTWQSDNRLARMVYNYVYLGKGGSSYNYLEFNQTFTHECGHYLDLRHTFEGTSCTGPGDFCADTPPTDGAGKGCEAIQCGGLINGENYMDYNTSCYKNFTADQNKRMEAALLTPSRKSLWQYDNAVATGLLSYNSNNPCVNEYPFISYSKNFVKESESNDGSIGGNPIKIYASAGVKFTEAGRNLEPGIHYILQGVPQGLTEQLEVDESGEIIICSFKGKALYHNQNNSVQLSFILKDPAFTSGDAESIKNIEKTFSLTFLDPWKKTCEQVYAVANKDTSWNSFELSGPINRFYGLLRKDSVYYLENYGRAIITQNQSNDNVVFIEPGTEIGSSSLWRSGGNQGILYSSSYTDLDDKQGYIGFRTQAGNNFFYGWMKVSVSSKNGCRLLEYQYNEKPNEAIIAGAPCDVPLSVTETKDHISFDIYPNPTNGNCNIKIHDSECIGGNIVVYSITGERILSTTINGNTVELSTVDINSGVYCIVIHNRYGMKQYIHTLIKSQ